MTAILPILGFGLSGFRSFDGGSSQLIGPFGKLNIVIGQNNAGKSNIIRFIRTDYRELTTPSDRAKTKSIAPHNSPQLPSSPPEAFVPLLVKTDAQSIVKAFPVAGANTNALEAISAVVNLNFRSAPDGYAWFPLTRGHCRRLHAQSVPYEGIDQAFAYRAWQYTHPNASGGSAREHWIPEVLSEYIAAAVPTPNIVYVPAFRRIPSRIEEFHEEYEKETDNTSSIIDILASYQSPGHRDLPDRKKFIAVEAFLRRVLKREISLSVAHNKTCIIVSEYQREIPLEALGTGIHQLVYLAVKAIAHEHAVVCVEEPELHFHPELQRELIQFLMTETTNQYFITTHSAHIMDTPGAHVIHVSLKDGRSILSQPMCGRTRWKICQEMGYRASDLMQANSVVWVEGPSDRTYLLWWLSNVAPDLVEGRHFSIMFYGGRLISHISVANEAANDLIALLPINQNSAVLIDSDRSSEASGINETKRRVLEEARQCGGMGWVTAGREVENYVSAACRRAAIKKLYGADAELFDGDPTFGRGATFKVNRRAKLEKRADKIALARAIVEGDCETDVLDLDEQAAKLAEFIRVANRRS